MDDTTERTLDDAFELESPSAARLGLEPGERVRLLAGSSHTLLLGRERLGEPVVDGLVLAADLSMLPLADLLRTVGESRLSGLLHVTAGEHAKSLHLHGGEVVFATSNQPLDRLGESLVRAGVLTLEQLREAERAFASGQRFGKALVERGLLTPRELWHGVKYQVEEIVRSLFLYERARLWLWQGPLQADNVVRLALPLPRLISEGIARRDEVQRLVRMLDDDRVRIASVPEAEPNLAANERVLWSALGSESSFRAARERAGLDAVTAARWIHLLRLAGAVRLVRAREATAYFGEEDLVVHDEEAVRERVTGYSKLLSMLAAPIVAAEGDAPLRERLGRAVEELAARFPDLLRGVAPGPGASFDPEALAQRAVALADAAEDQVDAAFEELASYLAFELRNHPAVSNAESVLDAAADLRASFGL